jgi:hypothetical protein
VSAVLLPAGAFIVYLLFDSRLRSSQKRAVVTKTRVHCGLRKQDGVFACDGTQPSVFIEARGKLVWSDVPDLSRCEEIARPLYASHGVGTHDENVFRV